MYRKELNEVFGSSAIAELDPGLAPAQTALSCSLRVEFRRRGRYAVIRLRGSAGMAESALLRTQLEALAGEKVPVIVLDLSGLEFIGSAGLAAIVHGHLKSREHHGQIRLAAPQPAVLEVIKRTRLTVLFPVYASVEQAVIS